jgi:AAA+ ATPase superfamily predicted ATPase
MNSECKKRDVKLVLMFDEAQEIRKVVGVEMTAILAHVYDYCKNILIVFTGSQFGLLEEILEPRPENPLYGRYIHRMPLRKFEEAQSIEFLKLGFRQKNVKVDEAHLRPVINAIDGIPGWLTDFGARLVGRKKLTPARTDVEKALQETVDNGKRLALQELDDFLKNREARERYLEMLKYLAVKESSWTELKRVIELKFGYIDDKNFTNLLAVLSGVGLVEKTEENYKIVDPLLREALRS